MRPLDRLETAVQEFFNTLRNTSTREDGKGDER
jgi:hypothetical protein